MKKYCIISMIACLVMAFIITPLLHEWYFTNENWDSINGKILRYLIGSLIFNGIVAWIIAVVNFKNIFNENHETETHKTLE